MHLQRVQIPDFRALKNVDIRFERAFSPKIFPLGSQNGGGKSTLLQVIFTLLHCSNDWKRLPYLQNLLTSFEHPPDLPQKTVAKFEIWDGQKVVELEFLSCNDLWLQQNLRGEAGTDLSFSASSERKHIRKNIPFDQRDVSELKGRYEKFDQQRRSGDLDLKELSNEHHGLISITELYEQYHYLQDSRSQEVQETFYETLDQKAREILAQRESDLKRRQERADRLPDISRTITDFVQSEQLLYITNYTFEEFSALKNEIALLCRVRGVEFTEAESFLKSLSEKVFLTAPATQIYLFLKPSQRKTLLGSHLGFEGYQKALSQVYLDNFSTYSFISVRDILQLFKEALNKDCWNVMETGEYGDHYHALVDDLSALLYAKEVYPESDLSGIVFQIEAEEGDEDEVIELAPEDLSHGELKRLNIYAWLKANHIEEAIVLMDEIEIALHPDWQYQIVSDLAEWGPTNQYILATHSFDLCEALTPAHVKELDPKLSKPTPRDNEPQSTRTTTTLSDHLAVTANQQ